MKVQVQVSIEATKEQVWNVISNIKDSAKVIKGIDKIEVLNDSGSSLVGFKWAETRTMFGKSASEEMYITEANEQNYYIAHAESNGYLYDTEMLLIESDNKVILSSQFNAEANTKMAKFFSPLFGWAFKRTIKKTLYGDLVDIKNYVESNY